MWAIIFLSVTMAQSTCTRYIDGNDYIAPTCNAAGVCWDFNGDTYDTCECCPKANLEDYCGKVVGEFDGVNCQTVIYYTAVYFGIVVQEGGQITCKNDGLEAAVPDLVNESSDALTAYGGVILPFECEICTADLNCDFFNDIPESGIFVKLGSDLNTYYDLNCARGNLPETNVRFCASNNDYGITAYNRIKNAIDLDNDYQRFIDAISASYGLLGQITRVYLKEVSLAQTVVRDTRLPTPAPTSKPTGIPTDKPLTVDVIDDTYCLGYVNEAKDLKFVDGGLSCRGSIDESWPGGKSCESPYIVCLPQENTPASLINDTNHRYNVVECQLECAFDQKCMGIEFVPDADSFRGDCILISAEINVVDVDNDYVYNADDTNFLERPDVICFEKRDFCYPHFEAKDLNETMLDCYCPNNRKGFYTKKVRRTVENTRFCGDDSSVDERIKKAQANRMFHLCENWCLFETTNPEQESWYWDPWQTCWRETYSGTGGHRAYCDRVIRNPDSIELKYVNFRAENLCDATSTPTKSPVLDMNTTYHLSEKAESCDEACAMQGKTCAAEQTTRVNLSETELNDAFLEAGFTCETVIMTNAEYTGWALPGVLNSRVCVNRQPTFSHLEDLDSDCNRILGAQWQRLCACY